MTSEKTSLTYWQSQLDEIFLEQMAMVHRGKNIEEAIREAYGHLICDPDRLQNADQADFKRLVNGWLSNKRFPKPNIYSKPLHDLK
jgi:hypothetical protein